MVALEEFALFLGRCFMMIGGFAFMLLLAALIVYVACRTWIQAIAAFWVTKNANSRIREYSKNREKFLEWLEEKEGKNEQ
jgi:hypothetical protein